jgi:hypothetical protein
MTAPEYDHPGMSLDGPSRHIVVEPLEEPVRRPQPVPAPERRDAPAPERPPEPAKTP